MEFYNYCVSQPDIPNVAMSFSDADVTAYIDGNSQWTIISKMDAPQTITIKWPKDVKFYNVTIGKTSVASISVKISGGTKFYLSASLTQAEDVKDAWSATIKESITRLPPGLAHRAWLLYLVRTWMMNNMWISR